MSVPLKLAQRFNAVPIKNLTDDFMNIDKIILKLI